MGAGPDQADAVMWDVAVPGRRDRLPGVRMAGFSPRRPDISVQMVPYPAVTLVVDLGAGLLVDHAGGRCDLGSVVAGLAPGEVTGHGRDLECLQVRLSPVAAHLVLGESSALGAGVLPLENVWGRDAVRLEDELRAATSWPSRFAIAEEVLGRRMSTGRTVDAEVAFVWRTLVRRRGLCRVEDLATDVGWSRKRLWSRFLSQLGIGPKRAARLIRFDQATRALAAGHGIPDVAACSGYFDQSHLHRDALEFAGVTPAALAHAPWLAVDDVAWAPGAPAR